MGTNGHDTLRPWASIFSLADHPALARGMVHADGMGGSVTRPAGCAGLVLAIGHSMGAGGLNDRGTVCRRAHRRGNKAGLSRGARTAHPTRACPGACARPLAAGCVGGSSVVLVRRVVHASAATAGPASALQVMARTAVPPPAAMQWETVAMTVMAVLCGAGVRRGLMHG